MHIERRSKLLFYARVNEASRMDMSIYEYRGPRETHDYGEPLGESCLLPPPPPNTVELNLYTCTRLLKCATKSRDASRPFLAENECTPLISRARAGVRGRGPRVRKRPRTPHPCDSREPCIEADFASFALARRCARNESRPVTTSPIRDRSPRAVALQLQPSQRQKTSATSKQRRDRSLGEVKIDTEKVKLSRSSSVSSFQRPIAEGTRELAVESSPERH